MKYLLTIALLLATLHAKEIQLTPQQAQLVAKKVWQNEGAGKDKYLIWWNKGEDFASLGIGHFIWFPKGHTERFREVFPMFIAYLEREHIPLPSWLNSNTSFPWSTKEAFFNAKTKKTQRYRELFGFLKTTQGYQALFMAQRLNQALPTILDTLKSKRSKKKIKQRFNAILYKKDGTVDPNGLYILLDYTNFKGEGTLESERYKGQGWGLLQVLENINDSEPNKAKAFALSAKEVLSRRIANSPKARGEERWRRGWNIRLDTYWR
jgi:hypothetical protein